MKVKAITNFEYPASLTVRNRIRSEQARGRRVPMEERGEMVDVREGQEIEAPADLLEGWLENGYVEGSDPTPSTSLRTGPTLPLSRGGS